MTSHPNCSRVDSSSPVRATSSPGCDAKASRSRVRSGASSQSGTFRNPATIDSCRTIRKWQRLAQIVRLGTKPELRQRPSQPAYNRWSSFGPERFSSPGCANRGIRHIHRATRLLGESGHTNCSWISQVQGQVRRAEEPEVRGLNLYRDSVSLCKANSLSRTMGLHSFVQLHLSGESIPKPASPSDLVAISAHSILVQWVSTTTAMWSESCARWRYWQSDVR
jgi:hypothetical protein